VPGANDTLTDRQANPVALQPVSSLNAWYDLDITALVRDWTADRQSNHGVVLRGFGHLSQVYHFGSSNHPMISLRPQLVIDYTAPVVPTPTPVTATPTATESLTPTVSVTPSPSPTPSVTASPTVTPPLTPTPGLEDQIIEIERRTGILEQLIRAIIDILQRASRVGP
jgi:hypothetical protein